MNFLKIVALSFCCFLINLTNAQNDSPCNVFTKFNVENQSFTLKKTTKYNIRKKKFISLKGKKRRRIPIEKTVHQTIQINQVGDELRFIFKDNQKADTLKVVCENEQLTIIQNQHFILYTKIIHLFFLEIAFAENDIELPKLSSNKSPELLHVVDTIVFNQRDTNIIGTKFKLENINFSEQNEAIQIDFTLIGLTTGGEHLEKKHDFDIHQIYDIKTKKLQKMWGTVEFRSNMWLAFPNVIQWEIEMTRQ